MLSCELYNIVLNNYRLIKYIFTWILYPIEESIVHRDSIITHPSGRNKRMQMPVSQYTIYTILSNVANGRDIIFQIS